MERLVGDPPAIGRFQQDEVVGEGHGAVHQCDPGAGGQAGHVDPVHRAAAGGLVGRRHTLEAFAIHVQRPGGEHTVTHGLDVRAGQERLPHVGRVVARMTEEIVFDGDQHCGLFGRQRGHGGGWGQCHCCGFDAPASGNSEISMLANLLYIKPSRDAVGNIFLSVVQVLLMRMDYPSPSDKRTDCLPLGKLYARAYTPCRTARYGAPFPARHRPQPRINTISVQI